ncbi:MAG: KOW domain-containing RNA-binding protein [Lachnospiraceae bacterium]|nr:KOW domain-containing RNA-binding protein [Lachnospiraceae bacterium]
MVGYIAYSLAGHDKSRLYFIIEENETWVWLADGKVRTLDNPKRKNKKHIQIIKNVDELMMKSIIDKTATNETIKRAIKLYCKDMMDKS